jgi:hypothetical protein
MLLKNIIKVNTVLVIATALYGCEATVDLPNQPLEAYSKIYMPQAVNGAISKTLKIKDSVQTVIYGANFGGLGYPDADIALSFNVNKAVVDSFNTANKTNYPILPDGSYTLSNPTAVIQKGALSTAPFNIAFKTVGAGAMNALKTYVLPISVSSSTSKVNEALRTTFYLIKAQPDLNDYPNYNRSTFKVIDFSSQEANREGPNNGRCIFTFDGDKNTFWHSQWQGGNFTSPHYFTVDMGETKTLHGFSFIGRQNDGGGKPNEVNVQVSSDNVTWVNAGSFNLLNNQNLQPQFLPEGFKSCRYFKLTVVSAYNASYTVLAELYPF